ncbi:MAG: bifunctional UDP-3-O-[3-hydroxymyristoyl] N-acetylglucosamine deacetylase/3-hydroxyacyl-ACP dehydratase [Rikenellaceae bacterium]
MNIKQRTLSAPISQKGKGLHTGISTTVTIKPSEENSGIKFVRVDTPDRVEIPALAEYVVDTSRSTVIGKGDVRISTIEHCLAALWGSYIDNAIIEIDGPEVPILDGSSKLWLEAIEEAGTTEQSADAIYFELPRKISYVVEEREVEIVGFSDDKLTISANVDFQNPVVGMQYATLKDRAEFNTSLSSCRTFAFYHEIQPLLAANLIKGGDLDNAIIIIGKPLNENEAKEAAEKLNEPLENIPNPGYMARGGLRFDNEIARHKLLDLCGDLSLIGCRLKGRVVATRPGHKANTEFAKLIRKEIKASEGLPPIAYNSNMKPVMDVNEIKRRLPHRPPFLLVDKIMELGSDYVIGIKQVTMNEPFFVGHFPEEPVMPGVLQIEAMAQCGGILALSKVEDPENYSTYFMKIDAVKFKRKVVPGDTLLFSLELSEPIRRGIVSMHGMAYVGNELACEADLMALVTKEKK